MNDVDPLSDIAAATEMPPAVVEHLLDVADSLKSAHDSTSRWRLIARHGLLAAWLEIIAQVQRIEVANTHRRLRERQC